METTLNIQVDILKKITRRAKQSRTSRSHIIAMLIKKAMDDISDPARMGTLVRYQKRRNAEEWHTFHLQLRIDDYEYFQDLRKLLKMSISNILAYAANKFLSLPSVTNTTDNYRYHNYVVLREIIDNIICWRFIWGYPPSIGRLLAHQ